jgi:hypothetical protein
MTERNHHLVITSSEFIEGSCLLLKKGNEGLERVARLELNGERMFVDVCPRPDFVFLPGSPKKCLENRGLRMCTHITSWRVVVEVRVGVRPPPRYKSDIDNRPDERRVPQTGRS